MSKFSGSEPSPADSPVCTKHPRQSPLCIRTTPQQCGHSACSCWGIPSESVMLLKSIVHHPPAGCWSLSALGSFVMARRSVPQTQFAGDDRLVSIGPASLAKAWRRRSLHVRSSVTPCTSTSTETEERSSKKRMRKKKTGFHADVPVRIWLR